MSEVDPNKMKVVELRSELSTRGLDTKGVKVDLVRRLKIAMDKEAGAVAGDENGTHIDGEEGATGAEEGAMDAEEGAMDAEDEILKDEDGLVDGDAVQEDEEENEKGDIKPEDLDEELENIEKAENDDANEETDAKKDNAEVEKMDTDEKKDKEQEKKDKDQEESPEKKKEGRGQKRRRSRSRDRNQKAEEKFVPPPLEDLEEMDPNKVVLDLYVSDLNLKLDASRYSATPLHQHGFGFMWAGAKACYGFNSGKICFEVKVVKHEECNALPKEEQNPHVVRVGVSDRSSSLQLGEEPLTYGFGGTGKFSTECKFEDYGKTFSEGDVVQCLANMDVDPIELSYAVNGEHLGVAKTIPREDLKESPLFPHVLTKNCTFEVNFGQKEEPFFPLPEGYQDYQYPEAIEVEQRVRGLTCPEKKEDCEMIMMCGLPGAGKTYWAMEHCKKNPEKMYNVLGTNSIIDKMKVMGLPRKRNYHGRWDVLIEKSTSCLNKMFDIAFRRRRNYILDQTNVYASAQRRKMRPFEGFQRKAVVIVPTDDEFKSRIAKRTKEEGKDVPDHAVLEMKGNFTLPKVGDWFTSVEFVELEEEEAQKLVDQYRKEGQAAGPRKRFRRDDRRDRRSGDRRNFSRNRSRNMGGGGDRWNQGGRNWGGQGGRNWGGSGGRSSQGNRNWGPPPGAGNQGRRSWGGGGGGGGGGGSGFRDGGRDGFRGPPSNRYNMPPANRFPNRPGPPNRGYGGGGGSGGGYNQGSQGAYQNYPQQNQWGQQWGGSSGGGGQWNPYQQYYQQNQGYYK